jgi:hypothetical protein
MPFHFAFDGFLGLHVLVADGQFSSDLTAFNVWVAGGPPVLHPEIYEHRANIFAVVSIGFLAAFSLVLWTLIRNRKCRTTVK